MAGICLSASSLQTLVINTDTSDPAPKKAFEMIIKKFEAENPDVKVEWNLFDHEGYKQSIQNFLNITRLMWRTGMPATGCVRL